MVGLDPVVEGLLVEAARGEDARIEAQKTPSAVWSAPEAAIGLGRFPAGIQATRLGG
jgi:hypothetical protein